MADTALCPSCGQRKHSAARSSDGLCDQCAGRGVWQDAAEAQEVVEREGEPPLCRLCGRAYYARVGEWYRCPRCDHMLLGTTLERATDQELFVRVVQLVLDPPKEPGPYGHPTHEVTLQLYGRGAKDWRDVPPGNYMLVRLPDKKGGQDGDNEA